MDYKEKYEQALKVAQRFYNNSVAITKKGLEDIFPELAESEDERIRKDIVEAVELHKDFTQERKEHIYAWLEKQGEHANFLNKIQIDDKVTRNEDGVLVNLSQLKRVAKPAEEYNITGIGSKNAQGKLGEMIKNLKPVNEVLEQNPAWSEDDQSNFNELSGFILETYRAEDASRLITWLNSIKDRVQLKQEWSEEDEEKMNWIIATLNNCSMRNSESLPMNESCEEWLKSLRPQNHNKWHSIDEKPVYPCNILYKAPNGNIFLFKYMEDGKPAGPETSYLHSFDDGEWMYLKDIESQSHWKPSDKQIDALEKECIAHSNYELCRLLEQLKKLMEE